MKLLIIDRFEGDLALCETEDRTLLSIPRELLPPDSKEGDCLRQDEQGSLFPDPETTALRRQQALDRTRRLTARAREQKNFKL